MNVTWRIADEALESERGKEAQLQGLVGLKGTAALVVYVQYLQRLPCRERRCLISFMKSFEKRYG